MRQKKGSKSSLFLIELIIVLFFFLLVAAVCVQVFAKSHTLSRSSRQLSHAQSLVSSVWEAVNGTDDPFSELSAFFPEGRYISSGFEVPYDKDFQPCEKSSAVYTLQIDLKQEGTDITGLITFKDSLQSQVIYSLDVYCHKSLSLSSGKEANP